MQVAVVTSADSNIHGCNDTRVGAAIKANDSHELIDLLLQNTRLIEQLDGPNLGLALSVVALSNDSRANQLFELLLKADQMINVEQFRLDLLVMRPDEVLLSPEVQVSMNDLVFRINCLLQTEHARRISPFRLQELYRSFTASGSDTSRLAELMTHAQLEEAQYVYSPNKSVCKRFCILV